MWKSKKSIITLVTLLLCVKITLALTLQGRVVSRENGEPLYGANVMIEGTEYGTATDENGNYYLEIPNLKEGILSISYIGYFKTKQRFDLKLKSKYTVEMAINPLFQLNEVVVTGTRSERLLEDVTVLIETLHQEELVSNGNSTVKDALEEVALFDFAPDRHGANITMRGLGPKYVLFLVDGERVSGEVKGNINFSKLNINTVDRIEVLKGASSSLYGSNAIGGVVNIITKEVSRPVELNISSKISEYNTREYNGLAGFQIGNLSASTSLLYKRSDGYDLTPNTINRTVEEYNYFNIGQKIKYKVNERLGVYGGASFFRQDRLEARRKIMKKYPRYYDFTANLGSVFRFSDDHKIKANWNSDSYTTKYVMENADNDEVKDYNHKASAFRFVSENILVKNHHVTTGIEFLHEKIYSTRVYDTRHSTEDYILFMQDDFVMRERWNVIVGFRLNNHSTYGHHFTPNVNLMYSLGRWNIRAAYGKGFKTPSLKELYLNWDHGGSGPYVYGNEGLKPETADHYSLSLEYHQLVSNVVVTIFRNDIVNMIDSRPEPGDPNVNYYRNVDEALTQGVELMASQTFFDNFQIYGGYTYVDAQNTKTDSRLLGRAGHQGNAGFKFLTDKWRVNLRGKFIGEKDWGSEANEETGEAENFIQSPHVIWKISCNRELFGYLNLGVGVDNIFDYTDKNYLTTPGRIVYGTISISY